ncbi:protein PLASTID MOVEMENT IMPAIRED 1-RELATED 1 [Mercurialis annua]|uniref:protein PLASTID MOVEMENT IMPAIRED 1-RELATED 1 n=1 Tax=Mercurialis annua TaxID=3986 RepID=UPI00215DFA96|nr:protein PLASTID MOVEMENT IMPAIRED 1-RELATED 1 [Mercurialis annua]
MMMSKIEVKKRVGEDSGNAKLLREIETISKALYLDKSSTRPSISAPSNRSKPAGNGKSQLLDAKSKIKHSSEESSNKDKKSIWNWKPLKALSNVRSRKFNCCFSLQVHTIEELPVSFENLSVRVHWKRRDGELVTHPMKVLDGNAEFEEKLTHTCMVYGSRSGPHHSAKYEAKHFLLFVSVIGVQELDLGKHRVDLTKFLPLTLEELEEEKSSGKWTTSFKLSGEAKGAVLNVSFGYVVVGDSPIPLGNYQNVPDLKRTNSRTAKPIPRFDQGEGKSTIRRTGSLPNSLNQQRRASSRSVEDVKDLHEVLPTSKSEVASQAVVLYQKFDEDKLNFSLDYKPELDVFTDHFDSVKSNICPVSKSSHVSHDNVENECERGEFDVKESATDFTQEKLAEVALETNAVLLVEDKVGGHEGSEGYGKLHQQDVGDDSHKMEPVVQDYIFKDDEICSKESVMKELDVALSNVTNLETEALDSPTEKETDATVRADYDINSNETSLSLDDVTESLENDFLDMLGIDDSSLGLSSGSEPESPRERLLREFERDALAEGFSLFDIGFGSEDQIECDYNRSTVSEWGNFSDDFELASAIQTAEEEHQLETHAETGTTRAKMLEDLETEALMRHWGLNDEAFQCSPPKSSTCFGFGSPIDLPPEEPLELPALGEGLGPCLQTTNGGFVRSMNPSLFQNAKNGGNLIMQVSNPVVVPAEMGSGVTDILQHLASVGIQKLSMQANKLMPLDDITGKTMHQVAWEAADTLTGSERQSILQNEVEIGQRVSGGQKKQERSSISKSHKFKSKMVKNEMGSEYVSVEDLAPLAMDKIEALSIEGLRIQSGMSDDAPSNISSQSIGEVSTFQGKGMNVNGSLELEGAAGLQLLDIKDNGDDIDGLMGLSLTLDEWMRLDSGDIGDEDQISEHTSKILAAHHASSLDVIRGGSKGERRRGKGSGRKGGLLGNNFTVALMVQLHDPLRNYEPVGTPMLALIQVERVFVPPKPKIYCKVSEVRFENDSHDESESVMDKSEENTKEKASEEEGIPQFCITDVQVAGLKTESGSSGKKLWGTSTQQQSGSRWLLANGMGKNNKQSLMKSKTSDKTLTTKQRGDKLWSISSRGRAK